jgi:hypothetical protein
MTVRQNKRERNVKASKNSQKQKRSAPKRKRSAQKRKRSAQKQQNKNQKRQNRTQKRQNKNKSKKRSTKRKRQRGGYADFSVLPGKINDNGIWVADMESTADFGVIGGSYQGHMLKGAEVGVQSQFDGTKLSGDKTVFDTVDESKARMSEDEAKKAVENKEAAREVLKRTDATLKELGDLSAIERKYHAAYDSYDGKPTDSAGDKVGVDPDNLEILTEYGADNVARADRYHELHEKHKDETEGIGNQIKEMAHSLHQDYKQDGEVAKARNFPPTK